MLVAVVRRSNNRVVSFTEGSARTCGRQECAEFYVIRDVPPDIDQMKCWEVVDGQLVEFVPPVLSRHIEEARFEEFRTVTDPMAAGGRQLPSDWAVYVQKLRDLTKDPSDPKGKKKDRSKAGLIARFPKRPDGTDAIEKLRNR